MKKVVAVLMVAVAVVALFGWAVRGTADHMYNKGTHRNCGGYWVQCERDTSGLWVYCSTCGVQLHR